MTRKKPPPPGFVPDAHGTQSACDDRTVDAIPVPDHVARSLVPGECLRYLTRDPFGGRMCCDVDRDVSAHAALSESAGALSACSISNANSDESRPCATRTSVSGPDD